MDSIENSTKNVKRKASHAVDDGFVITIREFTRGMDPSCVGVTRRGYLNNSAYPIKKRILTWADGFPKKINGVPTGFTPAVRDVFKVIAWKLLMDRGYAVFSYDTLADAAHCDPSTARAAVNYHLARGLIQFKTGGGWGKKERRQLANQYTVNLWAFINPEIGTIIDPPYYTGIYEWKACASVFHARLKGGQHAEIQHAVSIADAGLPGVSKKSGQHAENQHAIGGKKRRSSAKQHAEIQQLYPTKDRGAKTRHPPSSAKASSSGDTARPKDQSENDDSDYTIREMWIPLNTVAREVGTTPDEFLGSGNGVIGEGLDNLCKEHWLDGQPTFPFENDPPEDVSQFVCLDVVAGAGIHYPWADSTRLDIEDQSPTEKSTVFIRYKILIEARTG